MVDRTVVIAVHPDDETLGCGGTLLKYRSEGSEIHWLLVSAMTLEDGYSPERIANRKEEISTVAAAYGFKSVTELGIPAGRVDETPLSSLIGRIGQVFSTIQPTQVFLPFNYDPHSDHRHVFEAAYSCTKSFRCPSIKRIMMMETLSETDFASTATPGFVPNSFVDISDHLHKKVELMTVYESELKPHPFPRSEDGIRALATVRGAAAGCMYAESFVLLKEIR
jgi:LmbE family N-acetylglucosaminyl deacetylase